VLAGLAALAADGDVHATEKLFGALLPRVRNLARYLVRHDQDVDDLAQDALVALYRGLSSYRGEGSFRAWADRVTARRIFRSLKERRSRTTTMSLESSPEPRVEPHVELPAYAWRRTLVTCLDRLPLEQRQAVVMHFVVGMTVPEVAGEVGTPVETARSRIRLGMTKLKGLFAEDVESRTA
jgi:RNA polymerase sigma-70 factor (ECF subfamily)